MMNPHMPRLHMGCGESLRSHWLLGLVPALRKPQAAVRKPKSAKLRRERTRG